MKPRFLLLACAGITAAIAVAALAQAGGPTAKAEGVTFLGEPLTPEQIGLGRELYAANCASCHGSKLEGQPDWQRRLPNGRMPAPPHNETGHTWHHADRQLFTITQRGVSAVVPGYESDMPAFEGVLSDAEIAAVLAYIKSTWPERQREFQAKVSARDGGRS
ncbi:cytochrome c [Stappia sp. F7233]|uniref:Cytochrome c n=1 Tax=Stappia albiluteola TaxID=2758565 RepID=A0A839A8W2_9HYPH|nr:cytochrome c [Stappia albiluteola]MBA5775575.1 cytochrome c [Stappia albiluteola]